MNFKQLKITSSLKEKIEIIPLTEVIIFLMKRKFSSYLIWLNSQHFSTLHNLVKNFVPFLGTSQK